jgi:uncharacterized protein
MTIPTATAFGVAALAGLVGSGHCVAMCGPFAGFAGASRRDGWATTTAYQSGRLAAYLGLAVVAGVAGEALARVADVFALQRALTLATGAMLVLVGCSYLIGAPRLGTLGRWWGRIIGHLTSAARTAGPLAGPFLLGLSASLLPCGFLYTFALAAAAAGSFAGAVATMFGFWLGTAPALVAAGWLASRLHLLPFRHPRRVVGVALIVLGVIGVVSRWSVAPDAEGRPNCCAHAPA